jgi:hypothetical protein
MRIGAAGGEYLDLDCDHDRLVTLLVVLKRGGVSSILMEPPRRAAEDWSRGDRALANIRLAFVPLPRVESRDDAYRLPLADSALAAGIEPDELLKALDFPPAVRALLRKGKWAAGQRGPQPHLPPGSPEGGQFTSYGDGGAATPASGGAARVTPVLFDGSKTREDEPPPAKPDPARSLGLEPPAYGHAPFSPRVPPVSTVPDGGLITDGKPLAVPRLQVPTGSAAPDPNDGSSSSSPADNADKEKPRPKSACPPSEPDVKHGATPPATAWQRFVNFLANPTDPPPEGDAYFPPNPFSNNARVSHDDCIKSDLPNGIPGSQQGDMVEAKSKRLDYPLTNDMKGRSKAWAGFEDQVKRQNQSIAGSNRKIFYCFEGQAAADAAQTLTVRYPRSVFLRCGGKNP